MVQSQTYLDFSNIFSNILKKNYKHDKKKCPWLNSNHVINCVAVIDIKQTILELIFKKNKHFLSNPEPLPESETMSQWASVWQRAEEEVEPPANSPTTTCWSVFMGCTQSPASKIWAWQHNVKIKKKKSGFGVNAPFRLRPLRSTTTQWCESYRKEAELREFCIWSSCKHTLPSRGAGGWGGLIL